MAARRLAAATLIVAALTGCGSTPTGHVASESRTPTASASRSPVAPSPSPSPSPPASPVAFGPFPACTLPYDKVVSSTSDGADFAGGSVSGASAVWTADPDGEVVLEGGGLDMTVAAPVLRGSALSQDQSIAYDAEVKRWLPVTRSAVRADGLAYAYAEPFIATAGDTLWDSTRIHVVSLPDGGDRVIYSGTPLAVIAYQHEGIYVVHVKYYTDYAGPLSLLDPAGGATKSLPKGVSYFTFIDGGVAWTDLGRITPPALYRLDVTTGASEKWADVSDDQGSWMRFLGLDADGHPLVDIVRMGSDLEKLFVYTAPQTRTFIADVTLHYGAITDANGTWLTGDDGIYLLDASHHLAQVSRATGGNVAGRCL